MAIKHAADGCEINVAVYDNGQLVLVCSCCQQSWIGQVAPLEEADRSTRGTLAEAVRSNSEVLVSFNVDVPSFIAKLEE